LSLPHEIELLKAEQAFINAGKSSKTLVKFPDLRIVLIVMKANTIMKEHRTKGRISVQPLSGRVRMHVSEQIFELTNGDILVVEDSIPHDVEAVEDSTILLNIATLEK
jgi:quercetin dioxygenase-like cupin family protein